MKFIVWAYEFNDQIGGEIALHALCERLNQIGEDALIWPAWKPRLSNRASIRQLLCQAKWRLGSPWRKAFKTGPFSNSIAGPRDVEDAVVIYPEIVPGNPLGARRVVRWLLHRPGYHTGGVNFGPDELFFHYQDGFQDQAFPSERLTVSWRNETYLDLGLLTRSGSAYVLRKGKGRPIVHDLGNSICVDDMSHEERAAVFNRVEHVYSYDLYTMYSRYAAICGAVPVIVPDPELPRDAWIPREEERYGLAYGLDEVPWAIATRGKLLQHLTEERAEEDKMLRAFVRTCRQRFG